MKEVILDALIDTLKLLPYLLITFIVLEYIEHKFSKKNKDILAKNKKYGPILGGLLGALPQCGFSSIAANLFSARVITMGTLITVFLSTSDEMLPIMISEKANILIILRIILFKLIIGIIIGFIIDLVFRKKQLKQKETIKDMCEHDHCSCDHDGIFISSLKHTIKIALFILIANLVIGFIIFKVGEDNVSNILLHFEILYVYFFDLLFVIEFGYKEIYLHLRKHYQLSDFHIY